MTWTRTGVRADELREEAPRGVTIGERAVVLLRQDGRVLAVEGACPHLGGDLADGTVERGQLTCPLHGAVFDVATGEVRADPFGLVPPEGGVGPLAVYPARVVGTEVEVDL